MYDLTNKEVVVDTVVTESSNKSTFLKRLKAKRAAAESFYAATENIETENGTSKPKVLPWPTSLVTKTLPSCTFSTICLTRLSPKPVPLAYFLLASTR